jgi:hypothetical protein
MGEFSPRKVTAPPPAADNTKAMLQAWRYADAQRRIRQSSGQAGAFAVGGPSSVLGAGPGNKPGALGW